MFPSTRMKPGSAVIWAAIAFAVTVGGADEHELLPGDEPRVRGARKSQDLPGIKGIGLDPRRHISPAGKGRRFVFTGGWGFSALPDPRAGGQPRKAAD